MKLVLVGLSVLLSSVTIHAQSIEPGIWAAESSLDLNGIPLPSSKDEECITASEAKDIKKTLTKELQKHGCKPTKWNVKGSQTEISLQCSKSGLEAKGNLQGSVTAKKYSLSGNAEGNYKSIPSFATIALKGEWKKPCK